MKTIVLAAILALVPGCSMLNAVGIGANDLLPSLKYCDDVQYTRAGTTMEMRAKCKVPAG